MVICENVVSLLGTGSSQLAGSQSQQDLHHMEYVTQQPGPSKQNGEGAPQGPYQGHESDMTAEAVAAALNMPADASAALGLPPQMDHLHHQVGLLMPSMPGAGLSNAILNFPRS